MTEMNTKSNERRNQLGTKLETFFAQSHLTDNVSTINELKEKANTGNINIMMGQTFDDGQPVDLVKYSLFIISLSDILRAGGVRTSANWLIADHFITDINKEEGSEKVHEQVKNRVAYLSKINDVYKGDIGIVLSSELSKRESYKQNLSVLFKEGEKNELFKEKALEAVPKDRRDNPDAYKYPFEEIATIQSMNADVKIGPVYEKKYDEPARDVASLIGFNRYIAIQLKKGFLFGNPDVPSNIKTEIEEFGILPYKKDSKRMGNYRLDPINDSLEKTRELILATRDMRAITDLLAILNVARERLASKDTFPSVSQKSLNKDLTDDQVKAITLDLYLKFVYNPLRSE